MKLFSQWGFWAALVYIILGAGVLVYATTCNTAWCGLGGFIALMPALIPYEYFGGDMYTISSLTIWIIVAVNLIFFFFLFNFIQKLVQKRG